MTSNSDRTSWNRKGSDKQTVVCRVVLVIRSTLFMVIVACSDQTVCCGWGAQCWHDAGFEFTGQPEPFSPFLFLCFSPQSTDMHVRLTSDSKLCSGVNVAMQPGSLSSTYPDFHHIMAGLGHSCYFSVMQMSRVALETLNLLLLLQLREQSHNIKFHKWKTSISLSVWWF